jgi:hypothetical protein
MPILVVQPSGTVVQGLGDLSLQGTQMIITNVRF